EFVKPRPLVVDLAFVALDLVDLAARFGVGELAGQALAVDVDAAVDQRFRRTRSGMDVRFVHPRFGDRAERLGQCIESLKHLTLLTLRRVWPSGAQCYASWKNGAREAMATCLISARGCISAGLGPEVLGQPGCASFDSV